MKSALVSTVALAGVVHASAGLATGRPTPVFTGTCDKESRVAGLRKATA